MSAACIGIDIGGTSVKLGIFEKSGNLLKKWEIPTRRVGGGLGILDDIAESVRQISGELQIPLSDYLGAGMGFPGPVLSDGSCVKCANIGWESGNLSRELSGRLDGMKIVSGNDANVAALGELWQGSGKGCQNLVMVTLGTGVGAGIVLEEKIWVGRQGVAGEIGHIRVMDDETEICTCGGRGCLEQAASATGIVRMAGRILERETRASVLREVEKLSSKFVFDAAKAGDELALSVVDRSAYYLGKALAAVTMVLDPDAYIIGGGVSTAGSFLTDRIRKYHDELSPMATKKPDIRLAKLGNDAGIYGAARMILG